jgi:excisionase family DNA binding protein
VDTQTALTEPRLLLTPEQAAETLGLGRSSVYELMRARRIRSVKIGRSRRIPYASLLDFVSRLEHGEGSTARSADDP